jgi:hypothetical protein
VLNLNAFVEITPHRCGRTIFTSVYRSPRRITAMGALEVALRRDRSTGSWRQNKLAWYLLIRNTTACSYIYIR